ncbi:MAG: heme ABC transporter ATP-binding protein [Desulfobacteraceae bacterium 4572_123]|nr:MAG: heme ABC transporter ATP-binding protein [Desulfobacteraceae bacterium 4572_123]
MTAISVENLTQSFGQRTVLDRICFDVAAEQFFIIIGPNGSGKTTLLKLLTGLLAVQDGDITVMGRCLKDYNPRALAQQVAYVAQNVLVEFPFSVTEVVLMGRAPHLGLLGVETPEDLELAREAMIITDIIHLADRRLDELSGGERQRVLIARAICQRPRILLLDEPTSALDLAHQARIMDLMETLKNDHGITVVMISHELNLAAMYADQVLVLSRGQIACMGVPNQVLNKELLERVYECNLMVDMSSVGNYPMVHLVPRRFLG